MVFTPVRMSHCFCDVQFVTVKTWFQMGHSDTPILMFCSQLHHNRLQEFRVRWVRTPERAHDRPLQIRVHGGTVHVVTTKPRLCSEVYCPEQLQMYINAHASADISHQGRLAFFREVLTPCFPIDIEGLTNEIDPELLDLRDIHPSEFPRIDLVYVCYVQFVSLTANEEVARPEAVNID